MYFKSVNFHQAKQKLTLEAAPDWKAAVKAAKSNIRQIGAYIEAQAAAEAAAPSPTPSSVRW